MTVVSVISAEQLDASVAKHLESSLETDRVVSPTRDV